MSKSDRKMISIIPLKGTEVLTKRIEYYLEELYNKGQSKVVDITLIRFSTGDAKAVLEETVRGTEVYIIADVGNHDCGYYMYGKYVYMSPDEHFADLKRIISAIGGKAENITVIMPMLYSARQDRKISRESLDCAVALKELEGMGVKNIMTFDVHDDRVQNAVPYVSFDNLMPTYQVIKKMLRVYPKLQITEDELVVVSPDFGAANRNLTYANELGLEMGLFYKRRSKQKLEGGKYVIEAHKYIGPEVKDKIVFICDDIIASGETILDVVKQIKVLGARKIIIAATFGLFTEGIHKFQIAYEEGIFDNLFITNATYRIPELMNASWYNEVDISKYIAYYIYCVNTGKSIKEILDPHTKIQDLLQERTKDCKVYANC